MDRNDIKTSWFGEMEFNSFGGAWYPAVHVRDEDELASIAEYQLNEDDVLLCSFPRSGWSNFPFKRVAICSLFGRVIPKTITKWHRLPPCIARNALG